MSREGSVASRQAISVPGHVKGLAIRDLDGDGKAEVVITNNSGNNVTIVMGKSRL
jgi:hypothetical protein